MPWRASYALSGVEVRFSGIVSLQEILEVQEKIYNHSYQYGIQYVLVDCTDVTRADLWTNDIQQIADKDQAIAPSFTAIRYAIVAPNSDIFLMARMWENCHKEGGIISHLTATRTDAVDWLRSEGLNLPQEM